MLMIIGNVREALDSIWFAVYTSVMIKETKKSKSGQSQTVNLPKDNPWKPLIDACGKFPDDFMETRDQGGEQKREGID